MPPQTETGREKKAGIQMLLAGRLTRLFHGDNKMPIYVRCPHCGKRIPAGIKCGCGFKREYAAPEGTRKLYHTKRWQKLRATILSMYNGLDPYAQSLGRIEYAETVHHIIPAEEEPALFYSIDNLIPLSRHSHDEVHVLYRKSKETKEETQTILSSLLREPSW